MIREEREISIAKQTAAGREALAVLQRVRSDLTGEQRLEKAFELTETTRQVMRAGIEAANPAHDPEFIQELYVDRLLSCHGLSLEIVRKLRQDEQDAFDF